MSAAQLIIRRAEGSERDRVARILIPRAATLDPDIFVASRVDDERPCGGAAVWFKPSRHFPQRAFGMIQVRKSQRLQGIGHELLGCVIEASRQKEVTSLSTLPLDEATPGFEFLSACGFQVKDRIRRFKAPISEFAAVSHSIYDRLAKRGKIPAGAQIISLAEAPREEVCRLILENLGFSTQRVAERLRTNEYGFSQTLSRVALLDGKMIGALLLTNQNARIMIDALAIVPAHRRTWVNAALKRSVVLELAARGIQEVSFSASAKQHRDSVNVAQRHKMSLIKSIVTATLQLKPA